MSIRVDESAAGFAPTAASRQIFLTSRQETRRLILGSFGFALFFLYPILCDSSSPNPGIGLWLIRPDFHRLSAIPGPGDRNMFAALRWVPYYTLSHFHQLPFWNPYKCGGMSMIGNPESAIVTPFLILYLTFGLTPGILLEIYLHLAIMFAGGYVLGRELGLGSLACIALAAMFPSSSWLSLHIAAGHLNFLSAAYVPWILALLLAACRMKRWYPAAVGGLLCALTLTEGNYAFVFAAMLTAILATTLAAYRLSIRPLAAAVVIGVFALAFAALKLIPTAEMLTIYPRSWGDSYLTWRGLLISLFSRDQNVSHPLVASFFFSEYGGYIGAPFAVLASIGIVTAGRDALAWVVGAILFLFLYRGDTGPDALTVLLRHFPLGGNIGLCGRWVIPLVFCVGALAALGAQFLCGRRSIWGRRLAALLLAAGIADAWLVCALNYRYLFEPAEPGPPPSLTFRQYWVADPEYSFTEIGESNMGSVFCGSNGYTIAPGGFLDESGHLKRGSVRGYNEPGYRGEYYLLGSGEVNQTDWTPNRLSYDVNTRAATALVINQNMYPGWHLARGEGSVYAEDGLIAVRVPPGRQKIELVYTPRHFLAALILTLVAAAALTLIWWTETRTD